MSASTILPLLLGILFLASAAHVEFAHPRRFPRLARIPAPLASSRETPVDPGAIAALSADLADGPS